MHFPRTLTLLSCLALSGLLPAAAQTGNEVEAEVDAALLHLAERGALGSFDQPLTIARPAQVRSEEHTSELQSTMRISYAGICQKKKNKQKTRKRQKQIN